MNLFVPDKMQTFNVEACVYTYTYMESKTRYTPYVI